MNLRRILIAFAVAAVPMAARAEVKLHPLFSDNMVLQRDAMVPIWGTASPGESISITFACKYKDGANSTGGATKADDKGNWKYEFASGIATTDATVTVKGTNEITLKNVLVGDVWLCSGQSNMEFKIGGMKKDDLGKKAAETAKHADIRFFHLPYRPHAAPQSSFPVSKSVGTWLECTPETANGFSAVGYFFGRDLEKSQHVPIGLIESDWGGTSCQAWTSKPGLESDPLLKHYVDALANVSEAKALANYEKALAAHPAAVAAYKIAAEKAKAEGKPIPNAPRAPTKPVNGGVTQGTPSALFNGMIAPLLPFKIKGAIWYQGESNAGVAKEYRTLFPAMISDWRKQWGYDFPFFAVQLAPYIGNGSDKFNYAELRDAQYFATKKLKDVGLAVITDAGDERDIHPQRKEPAGVRLALAARAIAYGEKIEYSGPEFKSMKVEGNQAILAFDHVGGGLVSHGELLSGFQVCGEDKVFHAAKAEIKGENVVLTCEAVPKPVQVRYGWVNFAKPELNFFNKAGLPAVPFRCDDFPLTTK